MRNESLPVYCERAIVMLFLNLCCDYSVDVPCLEFSSKLEDQQTACHHGLLLHICVAGHFSPD